MQRFLSDQKTIIFLSAILAAIIYGGWAAYANYSHGFNASVMASAVQAIYAFTSTFIVGRIAEKVYVRFGCGFKGITVGFIIAFLVMLIIPIAVHLLAGTPEIIMTILPGLIWGALYIIGFLSLIERNRKK